MSTSPAARPEVPMPWQRPFLYSNIQALQGGPALPVSDGFVGPGLKQQFVFEPPAYAAGPESPQTGVAGSRRHRSARRPRGHRLQTTPTLNHRTAPSPQNTCPDQAGVRLGDFKGTGGSLIRRDPKQTPMWRIRPRQAGRAKTRSQPARNHRLTQHPIMLLS